MRSFNVLAGSAAGAALALTAACTSSPGGTGDSDNAEAGADEAQQGDQVPAQDGPWVVEGVLGQHQSGEYEHRLAIEPVERLEDRTVLRFTATALGDEDEWSIAPRFNRGTLGASESTHGLRLVDPVGQRYYYPLSNPEEDDLRLGTVWGSSVRPGAHYEWEVHYPRLPDEMERATLIIPGTHGVLTGLPVVDAEAPDSVPTEDPPDWRDVEPGETVPLPVVDSPMGDPEDNIHDLYGITEGEVIDRDSSTAEERIAVDADVLFDFDEDTLDSEAGAILDEVAEETRERADPDKPPISVVGHTDGVGDDSYNDDLSERRAQTVHDYLEAELGPDFVYETEGRGASEPVAEEGGDDDEEARARNRRVEVGYQIRDEYLVPEVTTDTEATEQHGATSIAPPAPLRTEREAVGTLNAEVWGDDFELEVYPFRRDGAFLIAEFTIVCEGSYIRPVTNKFDGDYPGSEFAEFSAVEPDSGDVYRAVRIGDEGSLDYVEPPVFPTLHEAGSSNPAFHFMPAPPLDVDTLTFDAGPFGQLDDVPIE